MKISKTIAAAVGFALAPAIASAAVIGGTDYAPEYDYGEFFSVADHHDFKVVLAGNPFPGSAMGSVARDLLPLMQAAKPRPALTFAYDVEAAKDQPDYRLVLVFDAANDLTAMAVCAGEFRHKPPVPGRPFNVFAVYCRNDLALSQTTAWTYATGPNEPQVQALFAQLFLVLFDDSPRRRFLFGPVGRRW